ncbi:MAG: YtxH domain-containing protein [Candidatus Liptonbacteria bacterium]|nr:YtxH domain-containing protein [Candidatus Liptonbacteria bacterium]
MKKNNSVKFLLEGGLVGAALGVAAGLLFASKSGEKLRGDINRKSAEFYAHLAPKLKKIKTMGEAEYKVLVKNALSAYGKAKKLSSQEEKAILSEAHKSWKHLRTHFKGYAKKR